MICNTFVTNHFRRAIEKRKQFRRCGRGDRRTEDRGQRTDVVREKPVASYQASHVAAVCVRAPGTGPGSRALSISVPPVLSSGLRPSSVLSPPASILSSPVYLPPLFPYAATSTRPFACYRLSR